MVRARAPVIPSAVLAELRGGSACPGGAGCVPRICQLGHEAGGGGPGDTALPIVTQQVGLEPTLKLGTPGSQAWWRGLQTQGGVYPGPTMPPRPLFPLLENGRSAALWKAQHRAGQQVGALPSQLSPPGPSPPLPCTPLCAQGLLVLEARRSLRLDSWQPRLGPPPPASRSPADPGLSPFLSPLGPALESPWGRRSTDVVPVPRHGRGRQAGPHSPSAGPVLRTL